MPNRCGINKICICFRCIKAITSKIRKKPMYSVLLIYNLGRASGNSVRTAVTVAVAWNAKHWTIPEYFYLNQKINMTKKFVRINVYVTVSNEFKLECGRVWQPEWYRILAKLWRVNIFALIISFAAIDFNRFCYFLTNDFTQQQIFTQKVLLFEIQNRSFSLHLFTFFPLITNHWRRQWNGMWLHKAERHSQTSTFI